MGKAVGKVLQIGAVVAGVAAIVATAGAALVPLAGTATLFGVSAGTFSLIASGLTLGGSLLAGKPKVPSASAATTDRLQASVNLRTPRTMVFGSTAMATDIRDQEWSGEQEYLHRFIVVASHRVRAIREIWFDDKLAWSSAAGVTAAYAGYLTVTPVSEGSADNAINIGPRMGSSRRYTGCAYVYLRYKLTGNSKKTESPFAGGSIPSRMTIVGDGLAVPDPRRSGFSAADQNTWSTEAGACRNPALVTLAYLLGWRINGKLAVGKGIPSARIDLASFATAANLCDEPVTRPDGTSEPRYRCDGIVSEGDDTGLVLDNLKASMNALLDDVDGKIRLSILHNDLATPIGDLTAADVLGEYTWDQTPPLNDTYNIVRGGYTDPSNTSLYQLVDYPEVSIASTDDLDRIETVNLPMVQSAGQAQRLAKLRLARQQYGGTFNAVFQATAWKFQKGDVIRFSFYPLGWSQKLFRIADMTVQVDGTVPMMLREEHLDIYAAYSDEATPIIGAAPTTYDPSLWPVIQGIVDIEAQIARAVSDGWLDPSEKRQARIDYDQRTGQRDALQARYVALGSPASITAARDAAFARVQDLYNYMQGLVPSWLDYTTLTPIPDRAAYQAAWKAASDALEAFGAAITGQKGDKGDKGDSSYTVLLTNESDNVPADAAGNVTSYAGLETFLDIYLGSTMVGDGAWAYSVAANPQGLVVYNSGRYFRVDGGLDPSEDTASLTLRATGAAGGPFAGLVFDKSFSLTKVRAGSDGAPVANISVQSSDIAIRYNGLDQMLTGDVTIRTTRSNSSAIPLFEIVSFDGTVHGYTGTAAALRDSYGAATFDTTGIDVLILKAAWLNFVMQGPYGGGLRVTAHLPGTTVTDTVSMVKVRDGTKGDAAPAISIAQSASQLRVGKDGNYAGGQTFRLDVTRKNLAGAPVFERNDGYVNTAAGYVAADPASFTSDGPDNLTLTASGAVANMNAFGGSLGRISFKAYVPGHPENAIASINRIRDGADGASAPLVRTQWSVNGVDGWHDNFFGADVYARQSNDNGATWGPAERRIGEGGAAGQNGEYSSFVHKRSATVPPTPADNSGDPPTDWSDAPPVGEGFLWQSKARFRSGVQLTSWSVPERITGEKGDKGDIGQPGTGINKPTVTVSSFNTWSGAGFTLIGETTALAVADGGIAVRAFLLYNTNAADGASGQLRASYRLTDGPEQFLPIGEAGSLATPASGPSPALPGLAQLDVATSGSVTPGNYIIRLYAKGETSGTATVRGSRSAMVVRNT